MAQFKFGDHSNGRDSFVSEQRVAEYTGVSIATVRRARKALRDKKWLIEKERGHAITGQKMAPVYWVTIPQFRPPAPKPKRAPRNRTGRNQWAKPEVTGDLLPEVKQTKKTSTPEVTGDHPSGLPFRGSNEPSEYVGGNSWEPRVSSGSPDGDREVGRLQETLADARGYPQVEHDDYWTSSPSGEEVDESPDAMAGRTEQGSAQADPWDSPSRCHICHQVIEGTPCITRSGHSTHEPCYRKFLAENPHLATKQK